jgi:hypothetical protein
MLKIWVRMLGDGGEGLERLLVKRLVRAVDRRARLQGEVSKVIGVVVLFPIDADDAVDGAVEVQMGGVHGWRRRG